MASHPAQALIGNANVKLAYGDTITVESVGYETEEYGDDEVVTEAWVYGLRQRRDDRTGAVKDEYESAARVEDILELRPSIFT